jgi:hypothetical protein
MTVRLALRSLLRSPAYAATSIGTVALTIALAAVVFAVVDGVLFKPLPYRDADGTGRKFHQSRSSWPEDPGARERGRSRNGLAGRLVVAETGLYVLFCRPGTPMFCGAANGYSRTREPQAERRR